MQVSLMSTAVAYRFGKVEQNFVLSFLGHRNCQYVRPIVAQRGREVSMGTIDWIEVASNNWVSSASNFEGAPDRKRIFLPNSSHPIRPIDTSPNIDADVVFLRAHNARRTRQQEESEPTERR